MGEFSPKDGLKLKDLTWPADSPQPPAGTPDKFHLRVVSLEEPPFVVVNDIDPISQQCPTGQSKCDWGTVEREINGQLR